MNHSKVKHYVSIVGIVMLAVYGAVYLVTVSEPNPGVVIAIVTGIAGLGGYSVRKHKQLEP